MQPHANGQQPAAEVQALKPGDRLPEAFWETQHKWVDREGNLRMQSFSAFRHRKLILLDFWATWCAPCLYSLHKLDSFQQKYGNDLAVLPVTNENEALAATFLKKEELQLSSLVEGNLKNYFPHRFIPYQVWISADTVMATSTGEYVTAANLDMALSGKSINVLTEQTDFYPYQPTAPLVFNGNGGDPDRLMAYALFTGYLPIQSAPSGKSNERIRYINYSLSLLVAQPFITTGEIPYYGAVNRVIAEVPDSICERLNFPDYHHLPPFTADSLARQWRFRNTYSCDIYMPGKRTRQEQMEFFKTQLNELLLRPLGLKFTFERKRIDCYVLSAAESGIQAADSTGAVVNRFNHDRSASYRNFPLKDIFSILGIQNRLHPVPMIYEVDQSVNVDMDFPASMRDLPKAAEAFRKIGLKFTIEKREIDMIVISQL